MICYPLALTADEMRALEDYWKLEEGSAWDFMYSLKEIDARYKSEHARAVNILRGKSLFLDYQPEFRCRCCSTPMPITSRKEYKDRVLKKSDNVCDGCRIILKKIEMDNAKKILNDYKSDVFKYFNTYIEIKNLTFCELFYFMIILYSNKDENRFLSDSTTSLSTIGIETADNKMIASLQKKKLLTYLPKLPDEIREADNLIYGIFDKVKYDKWGREITFSRHPDSLSPGIYLNLTREDLNVSNPEVLSIINDIHQRLTSPDLSNREIEQLQHAIQEIQAQKLFLLVEKVEKEYRFSICKSNELIALLEYLSLSYSPLDLHYTFWAIAREAVAEIRKDSLPHYVAEHVFTKMVGDYIRKVEKNGWSLKHSRRLPATIHASAFETSFARVYIENHFNFDGLSAKEVVRLCLAGMGSSLELDELPVDHE